jgi:phospholipase/carboxylesterase
MAGSRLLYTAHIPAGDGPFPAVLLIHGWGASAHDLIGLAPMLHDGQAIVLCPQGEVRVPLGGGAWGYGWFPLRAGQPVDREAFRQAADSLRELLAQAEERYPIDRRRVAVAGFSQGGTMAFDLALRDPELVAGLAALSTWLPPELAADLPPSEARSNFPVLVIHGTEDPLVSIERARETRELLRSLGVALTYREFEMAHEIRPEALRVVQRWLEERVFSGR